MGPLKEKLTGCQRCLQWLLLFQHWERSTLTWQFLLSTFITKGDQVCLQIWAAPFSGLLSAVWNIIPRARAAELERFVCEVVYPESYRSQKTGYMHTTLCKQAVLLKFASVPLKIQDWPGGKQKPPISCKNRLSVGSWISFCCSWSANINFQFDILLLGSQQRTFRFWVLGPITAVFVQAAAICKGSTESS